MPKITFSVKDYKQKDKKGLPIIKNLTLNVLEFIRRFLLHVLPKGFQRIRYFGILAIRNRKTKLKAVQALLKHHPPAINTSSTGNKSFTLERTISTVNWKRPRCLFFLWQEDFKYARIYSSKMDTNWGSYRIHVKSSHSKRSFVIKEITKCNCL